MNDTIMYVSFSTVLQLMSLEIALPGFWDWKTLILGFNPGIETGCKSDPVIG